MIDADPYLRALINKRIDVVFARHRLGLSVSHGLFSSSSLDAGTASLLRLLETTIDLNRIESVYDMGCGTGALGLPVAVAANSRLLASDRDALATWFTRANATDLGHGPCETSCSLGGAEAAGGGFSVALSNLPAKAGGPVLDQMIAGLARAAATDGICGTVIVRPLYDAMKTHLRNVCAAVEHERVTANHVATLWRSGCMPEREASGGANSELQSYIRETTTFEGPKRPYVADTVYGLPDFDTLGFRMALLFDFLRGLQLGGKVLVYGAGQGHLPVGCIQSGASDLVIADRDTLALAISARNIHSDTQTLTVPTLASAVASLPEQSAEWLIVNDDPIPGSLWQEEIKESAMHLLSDGAKLLVLSRSTASVRLEQSIGTSFRRVDARKHKGFRAATWKRIDIGRRP